MPDLEHNDAPAPSSSAPPPDPSERVRIVSVVLDRLLVLVSLVCGTWLITHEEQRDIALLLLGGSLGTMRPLATRPALVRSMPLIVGGMAFAAAHVLTGCGQVGAVARATCGAVSVAHEACMVAGLAPDEPCPVDPYR